MNYRLRRELVIEEIADKINHLRGFKMGFENRNAMPRRNLDKLIVKLMVTADHNAREIELENGLE
jgi:hypothetical protein